ncbi:MAG: FtsX-like permease family protein [Lachnospiraceae bacterium]|nr:FtsX-like permease family protein [Lachnospiraceae bacterium]
MINVDNQHIVREVAQKNYNSNIKRNIITILAIIITSFLIVSVVGIGISYWQMISERQIKMNGMDYDIELTEPTKAQVDIAKKMELIKYAGVSVKCAIVNKTDNKPTSKLQLYWIDNTCWNKQCLSALDKKTGGYPKNENEIMLSSEALRNIGIKKPTVGMKINMTYFPLSGNYYRNDTKKTSTDSGCINKQFILSGYYTDFTGSSKGYVSEAFYKTTGAKQTDFTQGTLKISLKNSLYSKKTIMKIQHQFKIHHRQVISEDSDSIDQFVKTITVLVLLLAMIFLSGSLFIFNTMYISVSKDIRLLGQMKTIGMTSKQLKGIIYYQAVINSCIGIPVGLSVGYFVSKNLIPMVMKMENIRLAGSDRFTKYPLLMLIAALFSIVTVLFSCSKPAKMAGNCSPIEATRYQNGGVRSIKETNGIQGMAWQNIFRDRKRAGIIMASFVVSIIVFLTVNVVIKENDSKSILNETWKYDLGIVNEKTLDSDEQVISEELNKKISNISGVDQTRPIYSAIIDAPYQQKLFGNYYKELYLSRYSPGNYKSDISKYEKGEKNIKKMFDSKIIGIDGNELKQVLKDSGPKINIKKFALGETALVCNWLSLSPKDAVNKNFYFSTDKSDKQDKVKIAGIIDDPTEFASGYTPYIVVSTNKFKELVKNPVIELIEVDYKKSLDKKTEKKIKEALKGNENISFESKLDLYNDMLGNERQIRVLGNGVGYIIAVLAVMNYVNMMIASVQNRKKEFATLESIGMTKKQQVKVLIKEGIIYASLSSVVAFALGIPISYVVFQNMNIYRLSFSVPFFSNAVLLLVVFMICSLIPVLVYKSVCSGTVIERMQSIGE